MYRVVCLLKFKFMLLDKKNDNLKFIYKRVDLVEKNW